MSIFETLKSVFARSTDNSPEDTASITEVKSSAEKVREDYDLDYSPESLKELDEAIEDWDDGRFSSAEIVDMSYPENVEKDGEDVLFTNFVHGFSSYFGETLRRNLDGKWTYKEIHEVREGLSSEHDRTVTTVSVSEEGRPVEILNITERCIRGEDSFYENYRLISDRK